MKAVTANRLTDGEVVFWRAGAWVEGFGDAELFDETREADVEAVVAKGKAQPTVVVDVYPIDLAPVPGRWTAAWPRSATANVSGPWAPPTNPPTASRPSAAR
jgi:hypothetical protein